MKVKVLTNIDDLDIPKETWNTLVSQNETNTIFQTYDWFHSWWSVYGRENALFFIIVYNDKGELSGFAPLAINDTYYRKRSLIFVGDGNADYLDFVLPENKKEALYQIFSTLKDNRHHWKRIMLHNIPAHSTTVGLVKSFRKSRLTYSTIEATIACPTLMIHNRESEAQHIANKYSTKRPFNYFKKSGELHHEIIKDNHDIDLHMENFFQQHIRRWKHTATPSLFLKESNKHFYRKLAARLLSENQLLFSVVKHNDIPLAYHYGFDYNAAVTWYKPAFDIEHAKHSPGILMARYLINYCLDNNKTELDFTIGNEPFKKRFTNMTRYNANLRIFTSRFGYSLFCALKMAKSLVKKIIGRQ